MDIFFFIFTVFAFGSLLGGFMLDGGSATSLLSPTSFMIVFGGTVGAIGVSFPLHILKDIGGVLKVLIKEKKYNTDELIDKLKDMCVQVRRNGLLCLESQIEGESDSIMRKGMRLLVDGSKFGGHKGIS